MKKRKVLFLCTDNSSRSQMAEGLLKHYYGATFDAFSAGTQPTRLHPHAAAVMKEIGIDIAGSHSKNLLQFSGFNFDYVITLCENTEMNCPLFLGAKETLCKSFEDPSDAKGTEKEMLEAFRDSRDEIKNWILDIFEGGTTHAGRKTDIAEKRAY